MATTVELTRIEALEKELDELKKQNSNADRSLERRMTLRAEKRFEQKSTGDYPLWKPLDFTMVERTWSDRITQNKLVEGFEKAGMVDIAKAVDSVALGPLIRQDLEPEIYDLFVAGFPLYEMMEKIPANGLVHVWNSQTGFGDAQFITELGSVVDDAGAYARQQANIAVLATRRGVSLKALNAVNAGGVNYDPMQREMRSGMLAMRHKLQVGICRLQDINNAAVTATDPNGLFDANAFNGLRYILQNVSPGANTITVDTITTPPAAGQTPISNAIRAAANAVIDAGGQPDAIILGVGAKEKVVLEQIPQIRIDNTVEVVPGLRVQKVVAGDSELPLLTVPGDSMGTYITAAPAATWVDAYVVDMDQLALAYLGSPGPTVLDIPLGVDGTLRKLNILFAMNGFVAHVPQFMARVKIRIA